MFRIPVLIALVAILATLTIGIAAGSSSAHATTVEPPRPQDALDSDIVASDPLPTTPTLRNRWVPLPVCHLVKVVDYVERWVFGALVQQPVYSVQHVCRIVNSWVDDFFFNRWRNPFNYHPDLPLMPTMGSERARCGSHYELC